MSEQLKYKIYDHEVVPPAGVWDAIANELNEQLTPSATADKLYDYEVSPPPGAWQAISAALETPEERTQAPVKRIPLRTPYRWIAAAAAIIILLTGGYYVLNTTADLDRTSTASAGAPANADQPVKLFPSASADQKTTASKPHTEPAHYYAVYTARKKEVAPVREKPLRCTHIKKAEEPANDMVISVATGQILGESGEPISDMSVVNPYNNKYISITAPNGQQTRISAKLAIAMPYFGMTGADINNLQTDKAAWKQLIQQWRDKIMHSAFTPSSSNFLDILEISDLIKD